MFPPPLTSKRLKQIQELRRDDPDVHELLWYIARLRSYVRRFDQLLESMPVRAAGTTDLLARCGEMEIGEEDFIQERRARNLPPPSPKPADADRYVEREAPNENGILAKVPGEYLDEARQSLPPVDLAEDRIYEAVVAAGHLGPIRVQFRRHKARHHKHSHWFWSAFKAERTEP
ncbi:hypothetical protein GCM10027287_17710 [Bordetella muralis]